VETDPEVIPDDWRKAAASVLREGNEHCIEWTKQAFLDWRAATLSQFRYEAYEAMAAYLSTPGATGARINLPEDGETFAFFFPYNERVLYAKLCLRPSKQRIKIISAHTPRRGDQLF
jgi:hypothetical protein